MDPRSPNKNAGPIFDRLDIVPLVIIAILASVTSICMFLYELDYVGNQINLVFLLAAGCWLAGCTVRLCSGESGAARVIEAFGLLSILSLLASITSAALVPGAGPLIDSTLAYADRLLVPWTDWPSLIMWLAAQSPSLDILSYIYVSLNWQPLFLIVVAGATGRTDTLRRFTASWAFAIALCILPFHWLPAQAPYAYYGIGPDQVPGNRVDLGFAFLKVLEGLRCGAIHTISPETITGLVSFPSFHACAAVLLAWTFSAWSWLRWPMIALNAAMLFSAIPIGAHYFIDIATGALAAVLAIAATHALDRRASRHRERQAPLPMSVPIQKPAPR